MNKEILRLAIPNIISNISVPLLSTVDTALMGRLSASHIGAVGIGSMIFNFIYWNFGFLRMGTTGISAQAFGRKDNQEIIDTLGRAYLIGLIVGLALILVQWPLNTLSQYLMRVIPTQQPLVSTYIYIRIWAAPATLGLYAFTGWFFGMQNAAYPLIITVFSNLFNIVLSFILVYQLEWGVAGVAWGTVIAQYLGLLIAIILFYWKYRSHLKYFSFKALVAYERFKVFLKINSDIFIRTFLLTLSFGFFYSSSSQYGELTLAANVILLQFITWMSYGIDGFAFASESLVGKYKGANNLPLMHRAIHYSFWWGMGLAITYSLVYLLFGINLIKLFTTETSVVQESKRYLVWIVLFPIISTPCYIWDGIYIGLTASKSMRNLMIGAIIIFFISFYTVGDWWHNHGLWFTLLLFMLARGIFQQIHYMRKGALNLK